MKNTVICQMCNQEMKDLTSHIFRKHNIKAAQYKEIYPNMPIRSDALLKLQSERVSGSKNPAYQHGGKFSPFSEKFINGTHNIESTKKKAKENKQKLNKDTTKIEYWLEKTNNNLEEAQKLLSERQSTFSLNICIEKYGEETGREIWLNRQEKWHKSYKKSNFSRVSQGLFWDISKKLDDLSIIHFAQLSENKEEDLSGVNNEMRLRLEKLILPDFIDTDQKKIIEFDGTYWHGIVGHGNKEREMEREFILISNGYKVLHINESEYKNDKNGTLQKCLNFLTQ